MKNEIKISVVMPVYGVESHLEASVNSVLNQTYKNFEIILVDDYSPDGCGALCDAFAEKEESVTVIHHSANKGLSEARNSGLAAAIGDYVFFMDSDDVIEPDLLESVALSLEKNKAQIVVFGLVEDYYDKQNVLKRSFPISYGRELLLNGFSDVRREVIDLEVKTLYGYAWNKIYELSFLRGLEARFETITLIEDIKFNVHVFQNAEAVNILNITPYHYMKRIDGSLTNKFVPDYFKLHRQRVAMIYEQHKEWNLCTHYIRNKLANIYVRYIFSALQRNCDERAGLSFAGRLKWIRELFSDTLFSELIPYAASDMKLLAVMIHLLQGKHTFACLSLGRLIFIIKNKLPILFSKVKQVR